ncbi:MAG: PAS domain-containing sensor histidine kinase [Chlamydiota bacterium]
MIVFKRLFFCAILGIVVVFSFPHLFPWSGSLWFWQAMVFVFYMLGMVFFCFRHKRFGISRSATCSCLGAKHPLELKKSVLECMECIFFQVDKNQKMVLWNDSFCKMSGYSKQEIVSMKLSDFFSENDTKRMTEALLHIEKDGFIKLDAALITKNREIIFYAFTLQTIKDEVGSIIGFVGVGKNQSDWKKIEQELLQQKKELETILDSVPAMVVYKDRENRFIRVNHAFEKVMGIPKAKIEGESCFTLFPEEAKKYWSDDVEVIEAGVPKRNIIESMKVPSGTIWVQTDKVPYYDEKGKIIGIIAFVLDITEKKKAEEVLEKIRKNKADFTSMVSHELRTPLTAIKESVSMMQEGVLGEINPKQKEFLEITKQNIDRLARLIGNVLDYQQLEEGRMKFYLQKNNLNDVVSGVEKLIRPLVKAKELDFSLDLEQNIPPIIFDKDAIIQVIINLIQNAIKATEKGSITIGTKQKENSVLLFVQDTGKGIKKEDVSKLFIPYEQLERMTGGSGLGLAISRQIIEFHHGKIWVESTLGKGSTFYFSLPL